MNESMFTHVMKMLRGVFSQPTADEKEELFKETLLLVLARATSADANIDPCEIEEVQSIYKRETGEDVEAKDVRVAALSDNYRETSFESVLAKAKSYFDPSEKKRIYQALADVIRSDSRINPMETEFYNKTITALGLTPSDISLG